MLLRYNALVGSVSVTTEPLQNVFSLRSARRSLAKKTVRLHNEHPIYIIPFLAPLENGASMKLPVSLQFLNLGQSVGLLGRMISSSQDLYLHKPTQTLNKRTNIHIYIYIYDL
jgi:hypothetical protein